MNEQIKVLNDGVVVPSIGFGTYKLKGAAGVNAITSAINQGYRLLDSAFNYENEGTVGAAVRQASVPREDLFVVSKLPGRRQRYSDALETIQESLYRFGLDYLDLYLIHWPNPKQGLYVEAWQALIDAKRWGLVRSIGVCNFLPEHMDTLEKETGVLPSINQVELHPYFNQAAQRKWDREHGVLTQAWSPLGRASAVLGDPLLGEIAEKHGKSIPQVILRWQVQMGVLPIPKATSVLRQRENLAVFEFSLTDEEMKMIDQLSKADGRLQNQDPAEYEEF